MTSREHTPLATWGAFHSTKNSEISGSKLNGTVKIPGKVFENLGIRFECTLYVGISGIIENFVFHSQQMSGLVSLPSVGFRTIQFRSLFATLQMNSSICFSGKITGRQDKLPVVFRLVCHIRLVSITNKLPSHLEMVFELPRQIRWNSYFKVPIYKS